MLEREVSDKLTELVGYTDGRPFMPERHGNDTDILVDAFLNNYPKHRIGIVLRNGRATVKIWTNDASLVTSEVQVSDKVSNMAVCKAIYKVIKEKV